ncbi:MAG: UDP-N-acetylglucosamine 2-epimerase (non-hydrolyzing) [Candidatus Kapabacteria bacterium]|nr:UDP-N-acetylglucosamine 2-epimerase (non-hydrolyzing) [Candidatus Kapabacteria bacterium]
MKKIAVIFGTRPDTIKLATVISELKKENDCFEVLTIASAQHRQMLDQVLEVFELKPDNDLNIMKPNQTLASITKDTIQELDDIFVKEKPDMVVVQGDTTTTFLGALAAFYRQIPVGHVEAGLRTYDKLNPFPEEVNRMLTSCITKLHFAPTATAKKALIKENNKKGDIFVTGNTVIDALEVAVRENFVFSVDKVNDIVAQNKRIALVTMHRRENWGEPMKNAAKAIKSLAVQYPDINFIFPVHLNPVVRNAVNPILSKLTNVFLIEPLDYLDFVNLMSRCFLIFTDSGGVQEEGPHFGIPILVFRKVTERPEAVKCGTVKLVGLNKSKIVKTAKNLIDNEEEYRKMASAVNPYGDGLASKRIVTIIKNYFGMGEELIEEFKL